MIGSPEQDAGRGAGAEARAGSSPPTRRGAAKLRKQMPPTIAAAERKARVAATQSPREHADQAAEADARRPAGRRAGCRDRSARAALARSRAGRRSAPARGRGASSSSTQAQKMKSGVGWRERDRAWRRASVLSTPPRKMGSDAVEAGEQLRCGSTSGRSAGRDRPAMRVSTALRQHVPRTRVRHSSTFPMKASVASSGEGLKSS